MADPDAMKRLGEWFKRVVKVHKNNCDYANSGRGSYTGTSNAHRTPTVEATRQSKLSSAIEIDIDRSPDGADAMAYAIPHSGFDPSPDHMPPSSGIVILREGEMMSPYLNIGLRNLGGRPLQVKNNPKVEKSSLKKANKERMQRKMDTDD